VFGGAFVTDPKNPFEALFKQAQDMTKAFPSVDAFSPKVFEAMMGTMPKDMMEMVFGDAVNKGGLDAKTRLLLTIAGMTTHGALSVTRWKRVPLNSILKRPLHRLRCLQAFRP
jgi:4-carboxymuconolactone decarboxylase